MSRSIFTVRWKRREVMSLLEQLELFLSAGLAIDRALSAVQDVMSPRRSSDIGRICGMVREGRGLSESMSAYVQLPDQLWDLIRHGEASGTIAEAMSLARSILEKADVIRSKCVSASIYPIVIAVLSSILVIGLMRGVMPQIAPLLAGLDADLPILTRIVMRCSDLMTSYGIYALCVGICMSIAARSAYRHSVTIRWYVHSILMATPVIGMISVMHAWSLFFRSSGSMIQAGLPASSAYATMSSCMTLLPLRDRTSTSSSLIGSGSTWASIMRDMSLRVPRSAVALISAGEASGQLGLSLIRAADAADRDIERMIASTVSLIEPALMAIMGTAVGAIALSIMMPIYEMSRILQG